MFIYPLLNECDKNCKKLFHSPLKSMQMEMIKVPGSWSHFFFFLHFCLRVATSIIATSPFLFISCFLQSSEPIQSACSLAPVVWSWTCWGVPNTLVTLKRFTEQAGLKDSPVCPLQTGGEEDRAARWPGHGKSPKPRPEQWRWRGHRDSWKARSFTCWAHLVWKPDICSTLFWILD